ncbi:hypothetical protein [Lachnoclostridium sp. An76]|uniref:hypothetical protein n=1 Tax=Lachnoclostridium sp. An76 TaxID=1965654 RepID=UPI0013A61844|nr:hypothetical protein [Lachnoclostridium sp. An76]
MLKEAPYVIIPVFRSKGLNGEYVSKLNPFATIWCVIENIFLAATSEKRQPDHPASAHDRLPACRAARPPDGKTYPYDSAAG